MVRAPCCEKVGLKKGPWTPQEDAILISHIQKYGHSNWRTLPKQAGLLRCGKSCRLRWINYLRPDIKRGNFTQEEEETIIKLHEMLGNRWSAIAAKLPGRTDNEIKNVWHTHLKKKLKQKKNELDNVSLLPKSDLNVNLQPKFKDSTVPSPPRLIQNSPMSPQSSVSDISTISDMSRSTAETDSTNIETIDSSSEIIPLIDEEFWSEPEVVENSSMEWKALGELEYALPKDIMESEYFSNGLDIIDDGMDFWYDVFVKAGGIEEFTGQLAYVLTVDREKTTKKF